MSDNDIDYKVNLLPYRTMRRLAAGQRYLFFIGAGVAAALCVVIVFHVLVSIRTGIQEQRNKFLESQIESVKKQIKEIERLKEDTSKLMARKQVVESLQVNRSRTVSLLNFVVTPPDGIYYSSVKQNGVNVTFVGYARTQEHVSTLLAQIAASDVLKDPRLVEIKTSLVKGERMSEFNIVSTFAPPAEKKVVPDKKGQSK